MPSDDPNSSPIFNCTQCGDCCKGYGGTYLSKTDIVRIADYIGMSPDAFMTTHCRMSGGKPLLAQKNDGYCAFWDRLCTIHPVKPRMCRQWPYIKSVLKAVENWRAMASMCPGMDADAPAEAVKQCVARELQGKSRQKE